MQGTKSRDFGFIILNMLYDRIWSLVRQKWVTSGCGLCELKLTREFKNAHTHTHTQNNLNYNSHPTVRQGYKLLDERRTTSNTLVTYEEIYVLLGHHATSSGNFLSTFRDNLSVTLQWPRNPRNHFWISQPLKIGPIRWSETSVKNYHSTPRNVADERRSHLHRGRVL